MDNCGKDQKKPDKRAVGMVVGWVPRMRWISSHRKKEHVSNVFLDSWRVERLIPTREDLVNPWQRVEAFPSVEEGVQRAGHA